jgi:hypothetical protein
MGKPNLNVVIDGQFAQQSYQESKDMAEKGNMPAAADRMDQTQHFLGRALQEAGINPNDPKHAEDGFKFLGTTAEQWKEDYQSTQILAAQQQMEKAADPKTAPQKAYEALVDAQQRMEKAGFADNSAAGLKLLGTDEKSVNQLMSDKYEALTLELAEQKVAPQGPKVQAPGAAQP